MLQQKSLKTREDECREHHIAVIPRGTILQRMASVIWAMIFIVGCHEVSADKDVLDFVTVYRLAHDQLPSSRTTKEYYRQTNALGMLLKTKSGKYIDSVEGMVPLKCSPAGQACEWKLSEGWGYSNIDIDEDKDFSIKVDAGISRETGTCENNNGGCLVFCVMQNGRPKCLCPNGGYSEGYQSCRHRSYPSEVITAPGSYLLTGQSRKMLLVIPPAKSTAHLNITVSGHHPNYGYHVVEVKEFPGLGVERLLLRFQQGMKQVETKNILEITHVNFGETSLQIRFLIPHLTLQDLRGRLHYEIQPNSKFICVSIIYASPFNNGTLLLNAEFKNGTSSEVPRVAASKFCNWKMERFLTPLDNLSNSTVRLVLEVFGQGTILHSIVGCSPFGNEDITVMSIVPPLPNIAQDKTPLKYNGQTIRCYNDGKYNYEEEKCICPAGFSGQKCEEGCGPNYFGNNCTVSCSDFAWGCSGMIFCKSNLPCLCASGYFGETCQSGCEAGYYGPSCRQVCGKCFPMACDRFTGLCDSGCESGFHPPLCHIPYTYPANPPSILHQVLQVVTIETKARNFKGMGQPEFYQIQYKQSNSTYSWMKQEVKRLQDATITAKISNLYPGINYDVRVVFIDVDGNSYQGELVPKTQFSSLCEVPTSTEYNIENYPTSSSIAASWKYTVKETECPVTGYTVVLQRRWNIIEYNVSLETIDFHHLLPGVLYELKVRANTRFGEAPFSPSVSVKTKDNAPRHVSNLQVRKNGSGKLLVTWKPPRFTGGHLTGYTITYTCTKFLACPDNCLDPERKISVDANQTYAELEGLSSHVQYYVLVAATSDDSGPYRVAYGLTQDTPPSATPRMSPTPVTFSSNTSLTVQWLPAEDCRHLNGYLVGYRYQLQAEDHTVVANGDTDSTNVTFHNLTPQTSYLAHIYVVSTGGLNMNKMLAINVSTAGTVPEEVQHLEVYKRGRRAIGLRWAPPTHSYGDIKSFSVSYCQLNNCAAEVKVHIAPITCIAWPKRFCYTIDNLMANKDYSLSVRAQNVHVNGYGKKATVIGTTSEAVPEAPVDLRVLSRTTDSLTLQWKPPRMFNGVLRSFLLNIEHTDSANASNCCVYFPLKEISVKNEQEKYIYEVTDLFPASKYFIGVSAKTMGIGPSSSLVVTTAPELPELVNPLRIIDNNNVIVSAASNFSGLTSTYLLLVLIPNGNSTSLIWDPELAEYLKNAVNSSFYVVQEYDPEDMVSSFKVEIGKGVGRQNGTIGVLEDPVLPSEYRIAFALVLDYDGAKNVGFFPAVDENNLDDTQDA